MDRKTCLPQVSKFLTKDQVDHLTDLHNEVTNIESYFKEYDFVPGVEANGFRSFVKMVNSFFNAFVTNEDNNLNFSQLKDMIPAFMKQLDIMKMMRNKKINEDRVTFTSDDDKIVKAILTSLTENDMKPFHGPMEMFYMPAHVRMVYTQVATLPALPFLGVDNLKKLYEDQDGWKVMQEFKVKNAMNADILQTKTNSNVGYKFAFSLLQGMMPATPGVHNRDVMLPLKIDWFIQHPGGIMEKEPQKYPVKILKTKAIDKELDAVYICSQEEGEPVKTQDDSLIIHYHGGGFLIFDPKFFVPTLTPWVVKLGVPVLCPNYRKTPEHKFPTNLQDCLDTYLFVTSGRPEVKDLLGFHPKKIVLTGDSAGGNLAVSVTFALNEIRRNNPSAFIKMPDAVVVQYPYSDPSMVMTPSEALCPISPIISPRFLESMPLAYLPTGIFLPRDNWVTREEEIGTWARILSPSFKEPLINNLAYDKMNELSNIPLNVNVCEFDPLLDQGLILAKKWPGSTVDVVHDVAHGWCAFAASGSFLKKELNQLLTRIASGLKIPFTPEE